MAERKKNSKGRFVAYVSSYTTSMQEKEKYGIRIYDVDLKAGRLAERGKVKITNSSYITSSHNGKYLYSITDTGVEAYRIEEDGNLTLINWAPINGMRGCYLATDREDRYLFCAGYHDGKVTVLKLKDNGGVGKITDEIYHKGLGLGTGRAFQPHVECVKMTRDNKYLCAADSGMDRTIVYEFNEKTGKLTNADVIHNDQGSAPRHIVFDRDGTHMYIVCEQKSSVEVYTYEDKDGEPEFERIQSISTNRDDDPVGTAASALSFSVDYKYLLSSDMTTNEVIIYKVNAKDGKLTKILSLPIAGAYPKDAVLLPDNKHLVSLNHESDSMTFFNFNEAAGTLVMNGKELHVERPNCIVLHQIS